MNRAERRRARAGATPHQRRMLEQLARMEALITSGTPLTIGPIVEDHDGTMKPGVAIGAEPHMIVHTPKGARGLAAMFEEHPGTALHDLGWIPQTLREAADESERMALALTTKARHA